MAEASAARASKAPVWFYIIGVVAVLWNGMGAVDYVMTQFRVEAYMAEFSEDQLAYFYGFPAWFVAVWAIAVWSALLASILLLIKNKLAAPIFLLSLAGFVINTVYSFAFTPALKIMGAGNVGFSALIFASLVFFWWFSRFSAKRGWLR